MGFLDRFFGKKNEKPKTLKPEGDREGAYLAAEEKEHNEVSHQNSLSDDQGDSIILKTPYEQLYPMFRNLIEVCDFCIERNYGIKSFVSC